MSPAIIVSVIYFAAFVFCLFLGLYIISINIKGSLNRIFFAICAALSAWLFSSAIETRAQDMDTFLLWKRLSVIGWGFLYSYLLHFVILLASGENRRIKPWVYFSVYLPAAITLFVFCLSTSAPKKFNPVETVFGWVNVFEYGTMEIFLSIYFVSIIISSILVLYRWGFKSKNRNIKAQSRLLIVSLSVSAVLGISVDIFISQYASYNLPLITPVVSLIYITAIFYCVRRYSLMCPKERQEPEYEKILSKAELDRYHKIVSFAYIVHSLANFFVQYYLRESPLYQIIITSSGYFVFGILILSIQFFNLRAKFRDLLFVGLISVSIPLLTALSARYITVSAWVVPATLVMLSVIYNNMGLLISLAVSITVTQVYIWIKRPLSIICIDSAEYITRMLFFGILLLMAGYVSKVYMHRLKDIESKIRVQKILSEISADFVSVTSETLDRKIYNLLFTSGKYYRAERAFVDLFAHKKVLYEWFDGIYEDEIGKLPQNKCSNPLWEDPASFGRILSVPESIFFSEERAASVQPEDKTKHLLTVPLEDHNTVLGVLCYVWNADEGRQSVRCQNAVEILANLLSVAITRTESETRILHLAYHNELTNLPNKSSFDMYVDTELEKGEKNDRALLLINYKDFKLVNLTFGYSYANNLIKKTAEKLSEFCGENCRLFHISIDRFAFFINGYNDKHELEIFCKDIIETIRSSFTEKFLGINIGIVELSEDLSDGDTLLKFAQLAAGKVREDLSFGYCFYDSKMEADLNRKEKIESELRNCIAETSSGSGIYLCYQPIVDLKTGRIFGFEALARMKSEALGLVAPLEFIPIAESSQLIYPIGNIILKKACRFLSILNLYGFSDVKIAVNVSAIQILRDEFLSDLFKIIDEYAISPGTLHIELTESVFSNNFDLINSKLSELQEKGIEVLIDDFGTGYSSFSRVRELNINGLKIDKYFLDKLPVIGPEKAITGDIISLAHKLGYYVIAEGVESKTQKQFLIDNDCDYMQGYLFSEPLTSKEAVIILKSQDFKETSSKKSSENNG
ncbi:MAG: EAL domain-containing protein [Clostridiales bacterium]|nr:EAL domain-containing protein [Clostridiales bacterium]